MPPRHQSLFNGLGKTGAALTIYEQSAGPEFKLGKKETHLGKYVDCCRAVFLAPVSDRLPKIYHIRILHHTLKRTSSG